MKQFEITKSELFQHPKFGNLRVLTDEKGDPWFVGKVIAEVLGYKNPAEAISDHVVSGDRKTLIFKDYSKTLLTKLWEGKDFRPKILINESGLYSLILASKLPAAIEFKHWVTSEVLESVNCMTMTQMAKEHGTTHAGLTKMLHEKGVIYLQSGQWMLYVDFCNHGLTRNRTHSYHDSVGVVHSHSYLVWTEKGRMFLDGILRRDLSPKEALRQVEQVAAPQVTNHVQLEINF